MITKITDQDLLEQTLLSLEGKILRMIGDDLRKDQEEIGSTGDGHIVFIYQDDVKLRIDVGFEKVGFEIFQTEDRMIGNDTHSKTLATLSYGHDVPNLIERVANQAVDILQSVET